MTNLSKRRLEEGLLKLFLPLVFLAVLIGVWTLLCKSVPSFPTPSGTLASMLEKLSDPLYINSENDKGIFWQLLNSLARVFGGFSLAVIVGVPVGLAVGMSKHVHWMINPFIQIFKPVSPLAWLPLALLVFKEINATAVLVLFLTSIWPIIANTALGVKSVSEDYLNVAKVLSFNPLEKVFKIILPVAVPYIFTGMRLSLGIGWLVIVAAEMLTGGIGIGFWIWDEYNNLNYTSIIVGILIVGVVGFILDLLMGLIAQRFDYRTHGA
jgi:nitrate/nitrite transport system permease protein